MTIIAAHKSDIGRKRKRNEDYVWVDEAAGFYIAADGMGGQEAGDIASKLASNTIGKFVAGRLKTHTKSLSKAAAKELLTNAIEVANETVFEAARAAGQRRRMGATIVVALMQPERGRAFISHAGDARAYLARGSALMQITEDDSWEFGAASDPTIKVPKIIKGMVTKAIGQSSSAINPSFTEVKIVPGDWLLLCSDGLWNMVKDEQILAELQKTDTNPSQTVDALINAANAAGGKDNITVVAIKMLPST